MSVRTFSSEYESETQGRGLETAGRDGSQLTPSRATLTHATIEQHRLIKTVVTCKIKHLQNINAKNVLVFYFTCNHF